jgi:Uma2 family endonuclease
MANTDTALINQIVDRDDIIYPDSDGQPMADNTKQFRWITTIKLNLDWIFGENSQVFVAGDHLWYPVQGNNKLRLAPDIMVVFDRPKGDRGSYQQWKENNIAPQVVFEILSPGNTTKEMTAKLHFYNQYGVEEYYLYDPDANQLSGWLRSASGLQPIANMQNWTSPRLGIKFDPAAQPELQIFAPNGALFTDFVDVSQRLQDTSQELQAKEQELQNVLDRNQKMAAKLRALGIDPNDILE